MVDLITSWIERPSRRPRQEAHAPMLFSIVWDLLSRCSCVSSARRYRRSRRDTEVAREAQGSRLRLMRASRVAALSGSSGGFGGTMLLEAMAGE